MRLATLRGRPKARDRRVVVLGLDGLPFTYLQKLLGAGELPNFAAVVGEGTCVQMDTTIPNVSSVAWATFMSGQNPGKHKIFGFIDREPGSRRLYIPNSRTMAATTLWETLSNVGKRVFAMNVPVTYPPRAVNGVVVGCFLSPSVEKAAPTPEIANALKRLNYCVDADSNLARRDKAEFLVHLDEVFERRLDAMRYFWRRERWDFFMAHIMETDRLHHFFWKEMEDEHETFAPAFLDFYRRLDDVVGEVRSWLDDDTTLVFLSDHGFCSIKQQVNVNTWLHENGFLSYVSDNGPAKGLETVAPGTRAYSLDPGRIFLSVRGREADGIIAGSAEYERVREGLAVALLEMRDPDSGEPMVDRVYRREEIYRGPYVSAAADLVLAMREGYDPKGAFRREALTFQDPALVGMHTTPDALLYVGGVPRLERRPHILDVAPTILDLVGAPVPPEMDGRSLLAD